MTVRNSDRPAVRRPARFALASGTLALLLAIPGHAQTTAPVPPAATVPAATDASDRIASRAPWLYSGSDIARDEAWQFGTLKNGVRYAVRRNGVPPGQVSIRVRIDAGSLMEDDRERGYAHLLEHLAFRGSEHVPDGEAKRFWQRLGATFGSDSNAQTSPTHTVYQLDLPAVTPANLDEAVKVMAGMARAPQITEAAIDAERLIVLAEQRETAGPQMRLNEAVQAHLYQNQRLAMRQPIGTEATLRAATTDSVAAFHRRWYRPDRTVVVVVGDADPATMEQLVARHFGGWQNDGVAPAVPSFGDPDPRGKVAAIAVEPDQPLTLTYARLRPWRHQPDTVAFTTQLYLDFIATQLINRRLETRARRGGNFLVATVEQQVVSRSTDVTSVSIFPHQGKWREALADVRGVIADATATPPSPGDIAREVREIAAVLDRELQNAQNEPGARLADEMVEAVDIGQVVASPAGDVALFARVQDQATPKRLLETTRRLFSGTATRLMATTAEPDSVTPAMLERELARVVRPDTTARLAIRQVSFADLPKLGAAGSVVDSRRLPGLQVEMLTLSNGVRVMLHDNDIEPGKVRINVRFGGGYRGTPATERGLLWAGEYGLLAGGVGTLGQDEIDQLTNGRKIQLNFDIDDDAFEYSAETSPADLADQLQLIAARLASPGWDGAPIVRLRAGMLAAYDQQESTPTAIINRDLDGLLRGGDPRWAAPDRDDIAALTPEGFRAFWEPLLAAGPIEVQLFGNLAGVDYRALLNRTLGALPPRPAVAAPTRAVPFPAATPTPLVLTHRGDANQGAALMAWPTGGGTADVQAARTLDVLAGVFQDRLFDRLRAADGASYSPLASSQWPLSFDNGGYVLVGSMVEPAAVPGFYAIARDIAADLSSQPITADELARVITPLKEQILRASTGNLFWMLQMEGATTEPDRLRALQSLFAGFDAVTPAMVQDAARRWLAPGQAWMASILPRDAAVATDGGVAVTPAPVIAPAATR